MRAVDVYWDSFGLKSSFSGISYCAQQLEMNLLNQGVEISHLPRFATRDYSWLPSKLSNSKIAWDLLMGRYLRRPPSLSKDSFILHGLANCNLPLSVDQMNLRGVLTIHDLIPLLAPHLVSSAASTQTRYCLSKILKWVHQVVCVSVWTRDVLVELFPIIRERTTVIQNGVGSYLGQDNRTINDSKIVGLFVSRFEPYKGFERIKGILRSSDKIHLTVVTDLKGVSYLKRHLSEYLAKERLIIRSQVLAKELDELFALSDFYVHTSRLEGFSLPVAQATRVGLPVVFQTGNAMDEIVNPMASVAMPEKAEPSDWGEAIFAATALKASQSQKQNHCEKLPTWSNAATSYHELYGKLSVD